MSDVPEVGEEVTFYDGDRISHRALVVKTWGQEKVSLVTFARGFGMSQPILHANVPPGGEPVEPYSFVRRAIPDTSLDRDEAAADD